MRKPFWSFTFLGTPWGREDALPETEIMLPAKEALPILQEDDGQISIDSEDNSEQQG